MQIQKTTVLDTARIREELNSFKNLRIESARSGSSGRALFLKFRQSDRALKYSIGARESYIGIIGNIPDSTENTLPGIEDNQIININQVNFDRILVIDLEKEDRLGKKIAAFLVLEMMPNMGDAYLVDTDFKIKSTLRRKRQKIYKYPDPLKKPTILNLTQEQLSAILEKAGDYPGEIYGLNERDILNLSATEDLDTDGLFHDLKEYVNEAIKPGPAWIISRGDDYIGYSLVKPKLQPDETAIEFESALLMYERYYGRVAGSIDKIKRIEDLKKTIKTLISKNLKKITRIKKGLEESKKADLYKTYGEMILSNISRIKKGADSVTLDPLYTDTDEKIKIKLDPSKSAAGNAEFYFKKSRKVSSSKETLEKRLQESERELAELEDIAVIIEQNPDSAERKLVEIGVLADPETKIPARKAIEPRKPYRRFRASCGWEILIGKSNKDNDELTFHIASKEDFWFHAWQAAGSHTVLRLPDKSSKPDKQTLLEVASLAAYYSKAKHSSKVPVIYTQVKYVRKPRKFPPGKVLVEREKQLMVKPADPELFLPNENNP